MKKNFQIKNLEPSKKMWTLIIMVMMTTMMILPAVSLSNGTTGVYVPLGPVAGGGGDDAIQTVTLQPNATEGKDTLITNQAGFEDDGFGAWSNMLVGNGSSNYRGLLEFDVQPTTGNVGSATLSLHCLGISGAPCNLTVYGISTPWSEGVGSSSSGTLGSAANWSYAYGYNTDFETDNGGLIGTNDWEWGTYSWAGAGTDPPWEPPAAYSGTNMWGTVLNDEYNNLGDNNTLTLTLDLSQSGLSNPALTFWDWYDVFEPFDHAEVYINGDMVLDRDTAYNPSTVWTQQIIDLTPYIGQVAVIEFSMWATTVVSRAGWYIDDIQVTQYSRAWNTPGGDYYPSYGSWQEVANVGMLSWDVTDIVQNWVNGSWANNGFIMVSDNPNPAGLNYARFYTSDDPTEGFWPKLTISYYAEINSQIPGQIMDEDDPTRVISLRGRGQGTIVHDSGPATNPGNTIPFYGASYDQCRFQALYYPEEVGAEGVIQRISFNRSVASQVGVYNNYKISMAHTSLNLLTNTFANNYDGYLVEVFPVADVVTNSSNGDSWIHFNLNGNFTYDSSHNLLIDIEWNGDNGINVGTDQSNPGTPDRRKYSFDGGAVGSNGDRVPVIRFETDVVDNAIVDDGTNQNFWPFASNEQTEMRCQMLYNHTLLNGTGLIDKIAFQGFRPYNEWFVMENLSIRMAYSQNDTLDLNFDSHASTTWVEVLNTPSINLSYDYTTEWMPIDVNNLFTYNGIDNLLIDIRWRGGYGIDPGVNWGLDLCVNYSSGYWSRIADIVYDSTVATNQQDCLHNIQLLFDESANLTWSASSSNPTLFLASVSGGFNLQITPQPDAFGSGTVYLVLANSDGFVASQQIPVTINPVNDAPEISGVPSPIYCIEDVNYSLDMTPYASDIDDDFVNLTFNTDSPYAFPNGHIIIFNYPEGITTDTVTITVEDPDGLTNSTVIDVEITPVNDEPIFSSYTDTIICHATVSRPYLLSPDDEETPGNLTVFVYSQYATVNGTTITFLYPKGVGSDTVTIYLHDEEIYGSQNNVSYTLHVTIIDHPEVVSHTPTGLNVTLTTTVTVTFDMAMNRSTTETSFSLSTPTRADINGTFSWNAANTMMTFTPETYLTVGPHEVTIGTAATEETGTEMLEAFSWNFTASVTADADGDGMPDSYEIDNGLNPIFDDSASDRDGDGASNLDEYIAGTDPRDPNDKPPSDIPWLLIILVILIVIIVIVVAIIMLMKKGKRDRRELEREAPPEQPPQEI